MSQPFRHILAELEVMKTFSIAKRISEEDIAILTEKYHKSRRKDISLTDYLGMTVASQMQEAFLNRTVPGLIFDDDVSEASPEDHQKMMQLAQFASLVAKKLAEKKLSKFFYCFTVHALVNMLGLSDRDFANFHRQFSELDDDDDEDD